MFSRVLFIIHVPVGTRAWYICYGEILGVNGDFQSFLDQMKKLDLLLVQSEKWLKSAVKKKVK